MMMFVTQHKVAHLKMLKKKVSQNIFLEKRSDQGVVVLKTKSTKKINKSLIETRRRQHAEEGQELKHENVAGDVLVLNSYMVVKQYTVIDRYDRVFFICCTRIERLHVL